MITENLVQAREAQYVGKNVITEGFVQAKENCM